MMKPCLDCGQPFQPSRTAPRARCTECQRAAYRSRERYRPPVQRAVYGSTAWKALARSVVALAVECHWCHEPSWRTKLTADHIERVVERPALALDPSNVVAACRSCQEKRKHRPDVSTWEPWERRPLP
jgi:hypothetical protein